MRKILCFILAVVLILGAAAFADGSDGTVTPSEPVETAEPTAEPTVEPTPEPTPEPTLDPAKIEGWALVMGAQGEEKKEDTLEALVLFADGAEADLVVTTPKTVELKDMRANLFAYLAFLPDPDLYASDLFRVRVTSEPPKDGAVQPDVDLSQYEDAPDEQLVTLYVWIERLPEPKPTDPPPARLSIGVSAQGYTPGQWSGVPAVFTLSGIPEGDAEHSYAAILFDSRFLDIEGDTFEAAIDGFYALRFVILDAIGDIVSASEQYTIRLDITPPDVVAAASMTQNYSLVLSASDTQSGLADASIDGGATWFALTEGEPYGYKAGAETVFAPQMIQVRDVAGNLWTNEEAIPLTKLPDTSGGGGGGGGGPRKTHSANTTGDSGTTEYDAAALTAGEEPVESLTLQDQAIGLLATLADGKTENRFLLAFAESVKEGEEAGKGPIAEHTGLVTEADDTLILTAFPPENGEKPLAYSWSFTGAALRTLSTSGISFLVLRSGDTVAILPTAGFTVGTRYTDLKIEGMSSRKFLYTAVFTPLLPDEGDAPRVADELNRTTDCEFALSVSVEDEEYTLLAKQTEEMYAEGVFIGPADMLEYPYGAYPEASAQAD